jgi:TetR/AcrR family transcriptional repressor of nem operon
MGDMKFPRARDATKAETREALMVAGITEFAEKGVDGPSLDAICARAGFTRGAFYVHFKDRDDLLVAVLDRILTTFQDAVIGNSDHPEDLEQTITRYISALMMQSPATHGSARWHFHDTLAACARIPPLRERYLGLQLEAIRRVAIAARAGQRAKTIRSDVPAETIAQILILVTLGLGAAIEIDMPIDVLSGGAAIKTFLAEPNPPTQKSKSKKTKSSRAR